MDKLLRGARKIEKFPKKLIHKQAKSTQPLLCFFHFILRSGFKVRQIIIILPLPHERIGSFRGKYHVYYYPGSPSTLERF